MANKTMPIENLPEWSKTIDPRYKADWTNLKPAAQSFLRMSALEQKEAVAEYSKKYCFPKLDLPKASGLYLLFRVLFELPAGGMDRAKVSSFGGWLHPSIGEPGAYQISWPVTATVEQGNLILTIDRFTGYSGKGYDGAAEFDFLRSHFPFRKEAEIANLTLR